MASFSVFEEEMQMEMQYENMNSSKFCDTVSSNCSNNIHECCYSPFTNSNINSNKSYKNEEKTIKWKNLSINIFTLLEEELKSNYIDKLTSPPYYSSLEKEEKSYITLIGIIKSNC